MQYKGVEGQRREAVRILNPDTGWSRVVSFKLRPFYSGDRSPSTIYIGSCVVLAAFLETAATEKKFRASETSGN
jgi:hypothetical protein